MPVDHALPQWRTTLTDSPPKFVPVPGVVVERSRAVTIRYVVLCFGVAAYSALQEYSWWNDRFGDGRGDSLFARSRFGFVFGVAGIAASVSFALWFLRSLRKSQRIIVGEDRYQVVEKVEDVDAVVVEIPYRNIAQVKRSRTAHGVQVELLLADPTDQDTHLGTRRGTLAGEGPIVSWPIFNGFRLRPYSIADELETAMSKWKATHQRGGTGSATSPAQRSPQENG